MTGTPRPRSPSTRTCLFGLVGHPVSHSLSPAMQNAGFRAAGIDAAYAAFDVPAEGLPAALAGARALGFGGLNVTVPHKEGALTLAAEADPVASLAGAANTLVPVSAGWKAFNTDVDGFLSAVREDLGMAPAGRRCLILGAGGSARAVAVALVRAGAQEILVANRNEERAEGLVRELRQRCGTEGIARIALEAAPQRLGPEGLLVSATPLGLSESGRWPWDLSRFAPGTAAFDLAYRAGDETPLVAQARARGLRAASGLSMLLYQGALAFSLWTGKPAPLAAMRQGLLQN